MIIFDEKWKKRKKKKLKNRIDKNQELKWEDVPLYILQSKDEDDDKHDEDSKDNLSYLFNFIMKIEEEKEKKMNELQTILGHSNCLILHLLDNKRL